MMIESEFYFNHKRIGILDILFSIELYFKL